MSLLIYFLQEILRAADGRNIIFLIFLMFRLENRSSNLIDLDLKDFEARRLIYIILPD